MTSTVAISTVAAAGERAEPLAELVAAARAGDRVAMETLIEAIERRVYAFAWRLVGDRAAAEDVSQEVFLKICQRLGQYRGDASFLAWVYRIVVNQARDYRRAAGPPTGEVPEIPVPPAVDVARDEQLQRLAQAMRLLSEKERAALTLLDLEGFSSPEAARILGSLAITVRARAAHARKKLRRALSHYYPELREGT